MGFGVWTRTMNAHRRVAVRVGERVRIVQMEGCMAHIRTDVRSGHVQEINAKTVYGDTELRPLVLVALDEGGFITLCAEQSNWTRTDDGVMEYRQ